MSKSLKIVNGDLAIEEGRSFATVTAGVKLSQDLKLWVLERIGTDPATPNYGSRLDGGTIDGREVESFIGQIGTPERLSEIRAEVNTLLSMYQRTQMEKMRRDTLLMGAHTLHPSEVLHRVERIETTMVGTTVFVRVWYQTLTGSTHRMIIPVEV